MQNLITKKLILTFLIFIVSTGVLAANDCPKLEGVYTCKVGKDDPFQIEIKYKIDQGVERFEIPIADIYVWVSADGKKNGSGTKYSAAKCTKGKLAVFYYEEITAEFAYTENTLFSWNKKAQLEWTPTRQFFIKGEGQDKVNVQYICEPLKIQTKGQ